MFEGISVKHITWGKGVIKSLSDGYITIDFNGSEKTLVFPDSFGKFLNTDDNTLIEYAKNERIKKEDKIAKQKEEEAAKLKEKLAQNKVVVKGDESDYETPLLGKKSGDILFPTDEDFYESIGYLTKPGRIAFYQAEIPEDRESQFKKLFPDQEYKVIKTSYGADGRITKQGCQIRINLSSIENCPECLLNHINVKENSWAGRINRSKFVLRLVQYNGFCFGHHQDYDKIYMLVPDKYKSAFEKGFNR